MTDANKIARHFIALTLLSAAIIGCKKERTCTCKTDGEVSTESIARNGGVVTKTKSNSTGETSNTRSNQTRRNAEKVFNCHDRTVTAVISYTSQNGTEISDVTQTTVTGYSCELK